MCGFQETFFNFLFISLVVVWTYLLNMVLFLLPYIYLCKEIVWRKTIPSLNLLRAIIWKTRKKIYPFVLKPISVQKTEVVTVSLKSKPLLVWSFLSLRKYFKDVIVFQSQQLFIAVVSSSDIQSKQLDHLSLTIVWTFKVITLLCGKLTL